MAELRELQRKLDSMKALKEIVNAMRNMAAVYVRRAEASLRAMRPYADVVETALVAALEQADIQRMEPPPGAPAIAVVFASDQGLCGTYNDRVVRAALEFRDQASERVELVAIGHRGRNLLTLRGAEPVLAADAPTSLEGIRTRVPELAAQVFETYTQRGAGRMFFIYNAYQSMGHFQEAVRRVLPVGLDELHPGEQRALRYEPILTMPPRELLSHLIEEYFFVELYRGLLESHASENGARLASMTAASSNIDRRLAVLKREFQMERQDAITAELLDVVGGAEALRTEGKKQRR